MTWKAQPDVRRDIDRSGAREAIEGLYNLRAFLRHAVLPLDYAVDARWAELIEPSEQGVSLITNATVTNEHYSEVELRLALLVKLYHTELLLDPRRCDPEQIRLLIHEELVSRRLLLPYRFGRLLYDKFNDEVTSGRTDHLEAPEAIALLTGTPQGIYQVGELTSGPLGLLRSAEERWIPPSPALPLWHCSDTGCGALHNVVFYPPQARIVKTVSQLERVAEDTLGPESEWEPVLRSLHRTGRWKRGRPFYDLVALLAEALADDERQTLFTRLLASSSASALRTALAESRGKAAAAGSPTDISARLSDPERLQLLLLLDDETLVRGIDRAIYDGAARIAIHEVRVPRLNAPRVRPRDRPGVLSSLGARATHDTPVLNLLSIIWRAYEAHALLEELGWRVRRRTGVPSRSVLADHLRAVDPREAVRDLILGSMPVTLFVCKELWLDAEEHGDLNVLADRILWKLGFDPSRFDDVLPLLRSRLQQFSDVLLRVGTIKSEGERATIRAAGVNLFVSVELFLEELVAYNTWVLASDHFVTTKFAYRHTDALLSVPSVLGPELAVNRERFRWNSNGGNTLGTSLLYAQRAASWMSALSASMATALERPTEDMPHYLDDLELPFPFRHREFWADSHRDALNAYTEGFVAIVAQSSQASVASIRNGLDHRRSDEAFPAMDAMLLCAARLREAVEQADARRYFPKPFWLKSRRGDRYARLEFVFEDYAGRELTMHGPTGTVGLPTPAFGRPLLIAAGELLAEYAATLRFKVTATGSFAEYWASYPRRRRIPSPHRDPEERAEP